MESLPLPVHLLIHLVLAALTGRLIGWKLKRPEWGLIAGLIGGFFIDLDHVLEYFLVFGWHFNLGLFLDGRQFLESGLIRIFFHAWEYAPIFFLLAWLFRRKITIMTFFTALAVSGIVHLTSDSIINNYPIYNYSLIYRYQSDFSAKQLLNDQQYSNFLEAREYFGLQ